MDCQLFDLPEAGRKFTWVDRLKRGVHWASRYLVRNTRRLVSDPAVLLEKLHVVRPREDAARRADAAPTVPAPLDLQEGERVRVKSLEQIGATLDGEGRCEGLGFMPNQAAFCGREFLVRQRIDRFFDERTRRMLRTRRIVILDDVYCRPALDLGVDYAGCQRSCFLFWKEAWLERI